MTERSRVVLLSDTASVAEVAWTIIGTIGLLINLSLAWQAWRDYRALIRLGKNGSRKIAARTAVGIQSGLALPQLIAVVIGVASMLTPPANPDIPVPPAVVAITVGLVVNEAILVAVGALTHIGRIRLLAYLDRTEESAGAARHAETMAELEHNTEISTEARDGAIDAFRAANAVNIKIAETNTVAGEASRQSGEEARKLREYLIGQDQSRSARQDAREIRQDARDVQQDKRDEGGQE